jgi:hypothetical protein
VPKRYGTPCRLKIWNAHGTKRARISRRWRLPIRSRLDIGAPHERRTISSSGAIGRDARRTSNVNSWRDDRADHRLPLIAAYFKSVAGGTLSIADGCCGTSYPSNS